MTSDDLRRGLEEVGARFDFGEYETEAYLAVLEHGQLTASEIAEKTDIPQPRVYDTVRSLSENGLVELRESRPIQVLAVDPEEAFEDVQSTLTTLVSSLSERYRAPARDAEAVSLITSRQTILRYLEEVISGAEYELVLSLTPDLLSRFEDEIKARRDAGVSIDLLLAPASEVPGPDEYDYSRVATTARARRGITTPIVAVADGTYSVYTTREALGRDGNRYGVIFNRSELGFLVSGFLNTVVWTSATTLLEGGEDRPFPRRYASIRRCAEDLEEGEGEFHVTVRGRDVETGERRLTRGRVVDVSLGPNRGTAALTVETDEGPVDVGGQVAALEDIEAYELLVGRSSPPELE
ncbi:ArsR family transcriptional regulator [Halobacteriales archaeon QS_4_70_19]|nr:MAG: ArsR family transcriptional regulator [Halobacteriales archaeon QS_4_70_19]